MFILTLILFFTILNSLISLIGFIFLSLNEKVLHKLLIILVAFASGALLGGSFFHLIPESYGKIGDTSLTYILLSILLFFIIEKFLRWRHCHKVECDTHAFAYLNLIGDGIHNCIDGMIIAASFLSSIELG
ncbi:MAG: ZIP family metal transporter, partial [Nitrososphaerales archaeon]